jgi:hypothetical protein
MGPIGYSPLAVKAVPAFVFNDKTGKVLDTDPKMVDLSTLASGGRGSYTYDAMSSDDKAVMASVTAAGMLSVALVHDVNFPYSDHKVTVTVSDGVEMKKQDVAVRRNKAPTGSAPTGDDAIGLQMVGTQHPHGSTEVDVSTAFMDNDALTVAGGANVVGNASFVMVMSGKKLMVKGLKSTETGDGDEDVPVEIDVTATDTGGLKKTLASLFTVSVNQAPKLNADGTLRDVAIRLTEIASSPLRLARIDGHFMDPEGEDLTYSSAINNKNINASVVCVTDTNGILSAPVATQDDGSCQDQAVHGLRINPLRAGTTIVTVTAMEPVDDPEDTDDEQAGGFDGFGQTVADTFTVTVLPE